LIPCLLFQRRANRLQPDGPWKAFRSIASNLKHACMCVS
jgi:hypothetical protein